MAKKSRKSDKAAPAPHGRSSMRYLRYCFILLLACVVVLTWLSLLSYSPDDWPSGQADPPQPVSNLAGRTGAWLAFQLRYWLGGGVYMGLLFATISAGVLLFGGRMRDLPWRMIGAALLVTATSTALHLRNPDHAVLPSVSSAGVLGRTVGAFLLPRFSEVGSIVIVAAGLLVGLILAAESFVLRLPKYGWRAIRKSGQIGGAVVGRMRSGDSAEPAEPTRIRRAGGEPSKPKLPRKPKPQSSPQAQPTLPFAGDAANSAKPPKKAKKPKSAPSRPKGSDDYHLPSQDLLAEPTEGYIESQRESASEKAGVLQQTLDDFNVQAEVVGHQTGPVITMYELSLAPGVKVSQIANLSTDIARALAVPGVRVVSPLPGRDTVGIEVPNLEKEIVRLKGLMDIRDEAERKYHLPVYLGKDAAGDAIVADLASMPHCLIAGTTGSGKSVCINTVIMSLLLTRTPEEVRLVLIDPKMVEMAAFEKIPHLLCPIVNDMRKAEGILEWAATKMDERYELLKEAGVRNIAGYNRLSEKELFERMGAEDDEERSRIPTHLPYHVIIVDELADLMMTSGKEVEGHIIRIAQKARAVGIHLVLATQRPSVNVVTGLIKANMGCKISFRVASRQESRIVLDQNGAEVLLGQGDMLFMKPGQSNLIRAQGTYIDDSEIHEVVRQLAENGEQEFDSELTRLQSGPSGDDLLERDDMFDKAVEVVLQSKRGSVSLLQRRLQIGYGRASRIIEQMAEAGILGEYKGSQARECLIDIDDWQAMQASIEADLSGESSANGEPTSA